ncbi:type II toxin-antitoxin system RelE/ParE family toxin [Aquisphaera giovannonii]|uniref:type II toxin-antitoxin system RelE/ParE family toxin n=1 Tax=Aquisphaera giovannonii TaxID=406548 RepID=UPI001AEF4849|nr:type II toxin-antitoxin system RelE/ParE family toxin [Aquisphaera giovannonii]
MAACHPRNQGLPRLSAHWHRDLWRILSAFDPNRTAILRIGGNKRGDRRWYKTFIPIADERFRRHLERLEQ